MSINANQLFNFIQGSDITGESAYDIWKGLGNEGSEADFLEYIRSGPQGEKGEPTHSYLLSASDTIMRRSVDGVLTPLNITFTGNYRIGTEAMKYEYAGRFIIQETADGIHWENTYVSENDESTKVYVPSNNEVKIIKCTLYSAGDTSVELDTRSIAVIKDVADISIGARNLLSGSDRKYTITKDTAEPIIDSISIVDGFDLQRLVNKKVILSYYVDTVGVYENIDDGLQDTSNRFGMSSVAVWSDSTGTNAETVTVHPFDMDSIEANKERVSTVYHLQAPEGYDTIDSLTFDIILSLKPYSENTWVFERPKFEVGTVPTDWTIAPEDVNNIDYSKIEFDTSEIIL